MPPLIFQHDLRLDGLPYKARRVGPGTRDATVDFVPQVDGQVDSPQLEPADSVTWHRGSGASRKMLPGMLSWGKRAWTGDPGYATGGPAVTAVTLPTAPDGDIVCSAEQDGHLYFAGGRRMIRIPSGSGAPVDEQDLGVGFVAASMRRFKTGFYVGGGTSGNMWRKQAGGAWSNTMVASAVQRGQLGGVFWNPSGVTRDNLVAQIGSTNIQYVASTQDPLNSGDWLPATPIDVGPYPITSLVGTRDHIYIATTGGLRDLDSSGLAPNLTPEVEQLVMDTNGQATLAKGGWIYYGAGYGLLRVRVANTNEYADVQHVTPKLGLPDESPVFGLPVAITRYADWIILAQWDSSAGSGGTTYISFGRESLGGYGQYAEKAFAGREVGPMVWNCSPIVLTGQKVTRLHVSGLQTANPLLWMAGVDGSSVRSLQYAQLPILTYYQDVRAGRALSFVTSWDLTESAEDWGDSSMPKVMPEVVVETEGLGGGSSMAVSVATDGNAMFSQVATLQEAPRATARTNTEVRGSRIQVRYTVSQQSAAPVILRKTSKRAIGRPDLREIRTYQLLIDRSLGLDPIQTRKRLVALKTGSTVTLRDEDGQSLNVLVTGALRFAELDVDVAGRNERRLTATLTCAVMQTTSGSTFRWGDGTRWGDPSKVYG